MNADQFICFLFNDFVLSAPILENIIAALTEGNYRPGKKSSMYISSFIMTNDDNGDNNDQRPNLDSSVAGDGGHEYPVPRYGPCPRDASSLGCHSRTE